MVHGRTIMDRYNPALGKASLWTAVGGFVLPVCFALLALVGVLLLKPRLLEPSWSEPGAVSALCGIFLVALELVALGCGMAARRTATGKAGLFLSGVPLLLVLLGALFVAEAFVGVSVWERLSR